ncbi:regulatory protein AfsR [Streptomyces davaonensis JCM 4913]|uniref:Regulatory protein AfsR n=1 Tax=Streptomyces davaonensis (strain DSM 101723 / JCM 4913 / KCC S-0913 / 768) TaxID=1214101 RepID=K4QT19_STRDJ|nr:BTAD domain-containing putative transcriptional regulator [Streptomyces davaonensis]CCK25631.1 regulatory protein AfsR [Streptomyces davaonensis JCM 4913]
MNVYEGSVRFAVLGPVRAWRGERELDLGSPQQRAVLVALLLRRGRPVTLDELLNTVWGEDLPTAAVSVVRTYVSRLRKVLEPGRDVPESERVVVSVGDGYLARIPESALDLAVFERRVAEAKKLRATGLVSDAAQLLHTALDGWQGAALAGVPGPLAESERNRLAEERMTVLEARLDADLELGRHGEVIAELISLTGTHPLRERLCRLLMLALYRSGRQAEALEAYRRARTTLADELGIDPGAPLKDLHERILAADTSLDLAPSAPPDPPAEPEPPAHERPVPAHPARPAQLPADLPAFVGRKAELDRVRALLPEHAGPPSAVVISAIGGMGGIGKTTLAVHWAHEIADRFPDGQLYINLRGFDPTGSVVAPETAIRIFLDSLGVPPMRVPAALDAQTALYRSMLAERRVLVLLDNARDAGQVRPLLPGSPGCLVIVTSRNQLTGLVVGEGAHPLTLDELTHAEAHDLLVRRLGSERPAAEPQAADEIIRQCARLPLALAIVAAHATAHAGFPLSAIAEELADSHGSLDAFAGGDDITTNLRAVFSWSYKALSAPAARLFRQLGLHFGPDISAPAAAALAGLTARETSGLLVELTRAHLLTEHFPGRYAQHDLLRVYAAERVHAEETPQERDRAVERLLAWYLHTADAAYPHLTPHRRRIPLEPLPDHCRPLDFTSYDDALNWCETELSNLVCAVRRAAKDGRQPGIAWRLPAVLWGFFYLRSHLHAWLDTAGTGLSAARAADDRQGEARALADTAAALRCFGRYDEAIDHYHQAMAAARDIGDIEARVSAVANLGDAYLQAGRLDKAVEYVRRGLVLDRVLDSAWGQGIALTNLGDAYQRLGRYDEALDCLGQALTVLRASDNHWVTGVALDILGTVHHRLHRLDAAADHYDQALQTHRKVGNRWGEGHTLSNLGDAQLAAGRPEAARASWRRALEIFAEFEHPDAEKVREKLGRPEDGSHGYRSGSASR